MFGSDFNSCRGCLLSGRVFTMASVSHLENDWAGVFGVRCCGEEPLG